MTLEMREGSGADGEGIVAWLRCWRAVRDLLLSEPPVPLQNQANDKDKALDRRSDGEG
jgi:hypothetical protein